MNKPDEFDEWTNFLLNLVQLKADNNIDAFMNAVYTGLTGKFKEKIINEDATLSPDEKKKSIWEVINYFKDIEDYEKCAVLKDTIIPYIK